MIDKNYILKATIESGNDPRLPVANRHYIAKDSDCILLYTDKQMEEHLKKLRKKCTK